MPSVAEEGPLAPPEECNYALSTWLCHDIMCAYMVTMLELYIGKIRK